MGGGLKANEKVKIVFELLGPKGEREVDQFNADFRKLLKKHKAKVTEKIWEPK